MSQIMGVLYAVLGKVMIFCFQLVRNYGLSIVLFTLLTKVLLFPVNLMLQKNSIRMVQLQPELNVLKTKYIDDKDTFTDEQLALYKKYGYHPLLDLVPLFVQIILVLGLVGVIYRPLSYALNLDRSVTDALSQWLTGTLGITDSGNAWQIAVMHQIQQGRSPADGALSGAVETIRGLNVHFLGLDLSERPTLSLNRLLTIPLFSGLSAWLMCHIQNRINVLQVTQATWNKVGVMLFTIAFSVYFSFLVPAGVGLYWICGNLFSILSMVGVNLVMPPKKHIDFAYLEKMEAERKKAEAVHRVNRKRERADYKRFCAVQDMQLMFYSESNGFYKYFKGFIDYICTHSDIQIHYVTSDPEDKIFKEHHPHITPYYIASDSYLIPLFMKLECDMCVMTLPDLEKYHIKRSRVRKDVEYVYTDHGIGSAALTYRKNALDWFDTVFCTGVDFKNEIREMEALYGSPEKRLVEVGYPLLDDMIAQYQAEEHPAHEKPRILIAPSWQPDNIADSCAEQLLDALSGSGCTVTLRPHPQHVRHEPEKFELLKEKYSGNPDIEIQTDFSSNNPVLEADLLITDWSGIGWEYAFTTKKPVLFINTPMKVMNPDYDKIKTKPITITMRSETGRVIEISELPQAAEIVREMLEHQDAYAEAIEAACKAHMYNVGKSGAVGGRYIIKSLRKEL